MKNVINVLTIICCLCLVNQIFAVDINELYEQAQNALMEGDYNEALIKVNEARTLIMVDPNLDPNEVYFNKLLPKIEAVAGKMESIDKQLDTLFHVIADNVVFVEIASSPDAVLQYLEQVRRAGSMLIEKRDSIYSLYDFKPEYRDGLRKIPNSKKIELLAGIGIIEQMVEKFEQIVIVLTDSIQSIDARYRTAADELKNMRKLVGVDRSKIKKLENELAQLSEERLNYLNTISEMLMGEPSPEKEKIQTSLVDKNVGAVFSNMIRSEITRIKEIGEVDSSGYKELYAHYQRIKNYNNIFSKNKVTQDQSELLAQYEAAIKNVKVTAVASQKYVTWLYIAIPVILLIFFIIVYKMNSAKKKRVAPLEDPPEVKGSPAMRKPDTR
jgi:hypothetical protein